jgi:hypothetical protein
VLTLAMRVVEAAVLILPAISRPASISIMLLMLIPALVLMGCLLFIAFDIARAHNGAALSFASAGPREAEPRSAI